MTTNGDPFACFGGDDDDDDEGVVNIETNEKGQALANLANSRMKSDDDEATVAAAAAASTKSSKIDELLEAAVSLEWTTKTSLWHGLPHNPLLYMGPMMLSSADAGGGRGYVAMCDIHPGTLLLMERPFFHWPSEQLGKPLNLSTIQSILEMEDVDAVQVVVGAMEQLHPTLSLVESAFTSNTQPSDEESRQVVQMFHLMKEQFGRSGDGSGDNTVDQLVSLVNLAKEKKISSSVSTNTLQERDIVRMLLTLRYNGFGSGVYLHFSMFNHDCDPNCIKFHPETEEDDDDALRLTSSTSLDSEENDQTTSYSEVRATKFIQKGEALTLQYMNPREVSHATRRTHLMEQHLFDIGPDPSANRKGMELVTNAIPASSATKAATDNENSSVTTNIEQTLEALEDMMAELLMEPNMSEQIQALELSCEELYLESKELLGNRNHLLLIRILRLQLDAMEAFLKAKESNNGDQNAGESLSLEERGTVTTKFVVSASELCRLQILLLGEHHPDVARTYHDLWKGIGVLLTNHAGKVPDVKLYSNDDNACRPNSTTKPKSFVEWSKEENRCRKEFERISSLYPRDAVTKQT
mmetsp:Transcript_42622/g.49823  ORF Transcript_42622/g.49823 Transcript_42622/m.49823 type:complete len:582 (-) Transcript_42622:59-1804(-)